MATWKNHTLLTAAACYGLGLSPVTSVAAVLSATLNDRLDAALFPRHAGKYCHRRLFHNLSFVSVLLFVSLYLAEFIRLKFGVLTHLYGVPVGLLLHLVLGDLVTPYGVFVFKERRSLKLFKTWSMAEHVYTAAVCGAFVMLRTSFGPSYLPILDAVYDAAFSYVDSTLFYLCLVNAYLESGVFF